MAQYESVSTGAVLYELERVLSRMEPSSEREQALALVAELSGRRCFGLEMLPLACWSLRDLRELRQNILGGLKRDSLAALGGGLRSALDWLSEVDFELERRRALPSLEMACGV